MKASEKDRMEGENLGAEAGVTWYESFECGFYPEKLVLNFPGDGICAATGLFPFFLTQQCERTAPESLSYKH